MYDKIPLNLEPLSPLDLRKCDSVGKIVAGMAHCSFGARMIGEAAHTWMAWIQESRSPHAILTDNTDPQTYALLTDAMVEEGWVQTVLLPQGTIDLNYTEPLVIIGPLNNHIQNFVKKRPELPILFINQYGMCRNGQIKDGHFPNAVFADPNFVIPCISAALSERLKGTKITATEFVDQLPETGLAGEIKQAAAALTGMIKDPACHKTLTLSGAMTVAQFSLVIRDMIELGMVNAIFSTGALMAHGLIAGTGLRHYKHNPAHSDQLLASLRLNRVTDTLEPETNFDHIEEVLRAVLENIPDGSVLSTHSFLRLIGQYLSEHYPGHPSILRSAYECNVPIYVPAFTDSEIGNDVMTYNMLQRQQGQRGIFINPEFDTLHRLEARLNLSRTGIISIGGGVPRNNAQNDPVAEDLIKKRLGAWRDPLLYAYGCRIAPDQPWYGNLGSCSYSENMSWGKMDPHGLFAEVHTDATLVWPLLIKYVMEQPSTQGQLST